MPPLKFIAKEKQGLPSLIAELSPQKQKTLLQKVHQSGRTDNNLNTLLLQTWLPRRLCKDGCVGCSNGRDRQFNFEKY
jgi:hypothetical protein